MNRTPPTQALLAGPRGRRLLLEYALGSESDKSRRLATAVWTAARVFEPPGATIWFGSARPSEPQPVTPAEVAQLLSQVALADVTPERLRAGLARSVDTARYWQELDGTDQLAATPEVRGALEFVADQLAPAISGWWRPVERDSQWAVQWDDTRIVAPAAISIEELRQARERQIDGERQAQHDRPIDPAANLSGDWWSMPAWLAPSTTGVTFDGSPAALWFVEDSMGWERGLVHHAAIATPARVFEVDGPEAWAELCRRFPITVTALKRHDWYRTTGRAGEWVIPDWTAVAEHYDGVHLQIGAYLTAAGTAIPVDDERGSVIAGWNPDETYWLTSAIRFEEPPQPWMSPDGQGLTWRRE